MTRSTCPYCGRTFLLLKGMSSALCPECDAAMPPRPEPKALPPAEAALWECGWIRMIAPVAPPAVLKERLESLWERLDDLASDDPRRGAPPPWRPGPHDGPLAREMARAAERWIMGLQAGASSGATPATSGAVRRRMTVEEANAFAVRLAEQQGSRFFGQSETAQARDIGCHLQTWRATALYHQADSQGRIKKRRRGVPAVVGLTDGVEARAATEKARQEALDRLMAEHHADYEPSSAEDDSTDRPSRKIHCPKRL